MPTPTTITITVVDQHDIFGTPPPPTPDDSTHEDELLGDIRVKKNEWTTRIQDAGCKKADLPKKTYKQAKILGVGDNKEMLFFFNLSAIAINYLKQMGKENKLGRGWSKVPKNKSDTKMNYQIIDFHEETR